MEDFGAWQRSDVTEVRFIGFQWVQSKALKSVHPTEDSSKTTLSPSYKKREKKIQKGGWLHSHYFCLWMLQHWMHLELVLKRYLKGFCPSLISNSKCSQNICRSRKLAGVPSKGSLFPQFRKVMGLVPHANKQDRKGVICFHTFPTSNKRQLAYRW